MPVREFEVVARSIEKRRVESDYPVWMNLPYMTPVVDRGKHSHQSLTSPTSPMGASLVRITSPLLGTCRRVQILYVFSCNIVHGIKCHIAISEHSVSSNHFKQSRSIDFGRSLVHTIHNGFTRFLYRNSLPAFTTLGECRVEVAFKQSSGILEILFGVGFGGGDAVKRFVEDADDAPLLREGRKWGSGKLR